MVLKRNAPIDIKLFLDLVVTGYLLHNLAHGILDNKVLKELKGFFVANLPLSHPLTQVA